MHEIIVLGGYGRVGRHCVSELVETTRARVVVAGRSIQRAEQVASVFGERARPAYANATDPRTLQPLIPGAVAVLACCGPSTQAVLEIAVETHVPFIGLTATLPETTSDLRPDEQAWKQQVPVILNAGAIPGLPGVLAELLTRRFATLHEIRIASTGPWTDTEIAQQDQRALRQTPRPEGEANAAEWSRPWRTLRWRFPEPIGVRWMRPTRSLDLHGFVDSHCVDRLVYLEPATGFIPSGVQQVLQRNRESGFALVAEAYREPGDRAPEERITLQAPDLLTASAAAVGALTRRILRGNLPGGFFTPHEALNPAIFLEVIAKRGVRVAFSAGTAAQ